MSILKPALGFLPALLLAACGGANGEPSQTSPNITKEEAAAMASDTAAGLPQDEVYANHIDRKMNAGKSATEIAKDDKFFKDLRDKQKKDEFQSGFDESVDEPSE